MAIVTKKYERKRSVYFRTAHENIAKLYDLGVFKREDLRWVLVSFDKWLEEYGNGKAAVLVKGGEYVFFRMICRFMKAYKRALWKRLSPLSSERFQHHLVLELDPHQFLRFVDLYDWIGKAWAKLRAWLYKKYGAFQFVKVLEPHKSLRPHLHVLISGIPFIDFKELEREWGERLRCGFVFRKSVRGGFNVVWYVFKYVCKMVKDERNKKFDRYFSAVLFATNKRMFSMSRKLSDKCVRKKAVVRSGFEYLGSVKVELLTLFLGGSFGMFLRVTPKTEDLYDNKELFFIDDGG